MSDVYIATKLERSKDHNEVRDALDSRGIGITYDWSIHGSVYRDGCNRIRQVAELEMKGVLTADAVVVLLPGGRGTHAELGMAIAAGKRVFLHSTTPDEHFGATPDTCAFYHHPLCSWHDGSFYDLADCVAEAVDGTEAKP